MKFRKVLLIFSLIICVVAFAGCTASTQRSCKSCSSDLAGGLNRVVNIYSLDGTLIATYEGLIDIDDNENGIHSPRHDNLKKIDAVLGCDVKDII